MLSLSIWTSLFVFGLPLTTGLETCTEVYSSATSTPSSGTYTFSNAIGDNFTVYCLFKSGYGYTFISADINVDPNLAQLFTEKTEVLIRHKRLHGQQYDATAAQISRYSSVNLGVLYNSSTGYNDLVNSHMAPYLYVGFVPKAGVSHQQDTQGWKVQGTDFTFTNCDGSPNSYFSLLYNSQNEAYVIEPSKDSVFIRVWYNYASQASSSDYIPDSFFASQFEIHFGGCGGYQTSTSYPNVAGVSIGLKFIFPCDTPGSITSGSRNFTGTSPGDTVTYSCSAGYTITSGDATRTCTSGSWNGTQPTCGVDGAWSSWSDYSSCSVTCGTGSISRSRSCDDPAPSAGGASCPGNDTETLTCTLAACITYDCTSNDYVQISNLPPNSNYYAMQGSTQCTVTSTGTTSISISGCLKDQHILLTYGSYADMETNSLHGGKSVNAVKVTCNEIPDAGNLHNITDTFAANLTIDETQAIDTTYSVTSNLSSTSVYVEDQITWTIYFPVEYRLEITDCTANPGLVYAPADKIALITDGGCTASSELISNFTNNGDGTATAIIDAFKFYNNDNVFLTCDLKICPNDSSQCDTTCSSMSKRDVHSIFKRSDRQSETLGFYPSRVQDVLTIIDPNENSAITATPFGWSFVFTLVILFCSSSANPLLQAIVSR